jgi:type IV pilus assembly protein PilF
MTPRFTPAVFPALAGLVAFTLLAGCVASGDSSRKVSNRDAAIANVQLGVAYMQQGNLSLAKEKLDRAEKQDPRNLELHSAMAELEQKLEHPSEAERHYQAALRLAPDSAEVANNYAVFLCRSGKVDQAVKLFDEAARNPLYRSPFAAYTNAAVCLRSNKRGAEAVAYLERAINLRPNFLDAVMELGDLQIEQGHPDLAGNVIDRYMSMGLASPEILVIGLRAAIARGDKPGTDNFARRLRRDFPNSAPTRSLPQLLRNPG